jgi:transposase
MLPDYNRGDMYVHVSRYKTYTRVRIVAYVRHNGTSATRIIEHIGSARDDTELAVLKARAEARIRELSPQLSLLDLLPEARYQAPRMTIASSFAHGLWQIVGGCYDRLDLPDNSLLKYLVLARIALPKSKLATTRWLARNLDLHIDVEAVYRYMDTLNKDQLMDRLLAHAQKRARLAGGIGVSLVFYDVTTLYFETDEEDEDIALPGGLSVLGLRKRGYSKDHRADQPQVVVGLTVDRDGFPLGFQAYEGNKYEGETLLGGVKTMQAKLQLKADHMTVVADAGMLNEKNLATLEAQGYCYIVGARLRSMSEPQSKLFLERDYVNKGPYDNTYKGHANRRLIVTYREDRAKRHKQNRDRLVRKLQARLDRGVVVRKSKYVLLDTDKKLNGQIDEAKVAADARYDGLRGFVTNTKLPIEEVMSRYGNLWQVEKSFRMSKSDLRTRPAFHFKRERILAHLLICVCSLAVLRELEQRVASIGLKQPAALEEILAIQSYRVRIPKQPDTIIYSELNPVQEQLVEL